jgi:hypothetical protein
MAGENLEFSALTAEEQESILAASKFIRETAGQYARLSAKCKALLSGNASLYVQNAVSKLAAETLIPNVTALDGAGAMTAQQWVQLTTLAQALVDLNTDTTYANCITAAGPVNCVGT